MWPDTAASTRPRIPVLSQCGSSSRFSGATFIHCYPCQLQEFDGPVCHSWAWSLLVLVVMSVRTWRAQGSTNLPQNIPIMEGTFFGRTHYGKCPFPSPGDRYEQTYDIDVFAPRRMVEQRLSLIIAFFTQYSVVRPWALVSTLKYKWNYYFSLFTILSNSSCSWHCHLHQIQMQGIFLFFLPCHMQWTQTVSHFY